MRNQNLDGARGIAALSVAIAHCELHYGGSAVIFLTARELIGAPVGVIAGRLWYTIFHADAAVVLFFVLSGHVLSRALEHRGQRPLEAALPYFVRRIFRLLPAGVVCAVPIIALLKPDAKAAIGTMFLVDHSLNGPIWSLQVEWIGCAITFLLWAVGSRLFALALISVIGYLLLSWQPWQLMFLPAFVLGYLIPSVPAAIWQSRSVLFVSLAALMLADLILGKLSLPMRAIEALGAFGVVGCLTASPLAVLHSRPVQFLGDISYPLYLCGTPAMLLVAPLLDRHFTEPHMLRQTAMLAAASVPIAILAGWIVHRMVERPGIRLGAYMLNAAGRMRVRGNATQ
jgi:peptidoglycan/LPS O-acetylase OafA/YrhL